MELTFPIQSTFNYIIKSIQVPFKTVIYYLKFHQYF